MKKNWLVWAVLFLAGFLAGIILMNLKLKSGEETCILLCESIRTRFLAAGIDKKVLFHYVAAGRMVPFALIFGLNFTRFRGVAGVAFAVIYGFFYGICLAACVVVWGFFGLCAGLAGIFPQVLCYAPAFLVLMSAERNEFISRKTTVFFMGMSLMLWLAGILLESFVNPPILKMFLRIF